MNSDVDILIKEGLIVTVDDGNRVLRNGAVALRGDRIIAVCLSDKLT